MAETNVISRKSPGRPFVKGQSGNPKGRPAQFPQFREECRKHSPAALARLVSELEVEGATGVKAAETILAYGWGRPTQVVEGTVQGGVTLLIETGIRRDSDPDD
jgi:hypothetical protein